MKKLLFTAVAVATGMVMANSVASSNIVGYQQVEATGGFNFTVPTFNPMGENIDIQDIQLVFAEGVTATGGDNLQILDAGGATVETFNWMPKEWMYPVPAKDGWADPMTGGMASKTIAKGEGFLVNIAAEGTKISYSGQVSTQQTVLSNTVQGFNWTGNNVPRDIDIQDIQLTFAEGVTATGGDNLQILDDGGATVETYNWMPKEWMYPVPAKDGWADPMTGGFATKNITAGQGFLVNIAVAGTEIVLPAGYTPAAQ